MVQFSSWVDLWDRAPNLIKYQENGLILHEKLNKFFIDFAKIQKDSFAAQKKLCDKYFIDTKKIYGIRNSYAMVFNEVIQVIQRLIDAESLIPFSFELHANCDGKHSVADDRKDIKNWKNDRSKLESEMKSQTRIIDDEIKRYRDKYRDMIKAKEEYERVNSDRTHSHLDVEKAFTYAHLKTSDFEKARRDCAIALEQFNLYRQDYYSRCLPRWADNGSKLEIKRHECTQNLINALSERLRVACERMSSVCNEFQSVCSNLDAEQDSADVISFLCSGNPPPGPVQFVDLASATLPKVSPSGTVANDITTNAANNNPVDSYPASLNSVESIYSTGSVVLPANFHCSVSAADQAALATSKLPITTGECIYTEPHTLNRNSSSMDPKVCRSNVVGNVASSTTLYPNVPSNNALANNGTGLLRRIFSRRSRHDLDSDPTQETLPTGQVNVLFEAAKPWRQSTRAGPHHKISLYGLRKKMSTRNRRGSFDDSILMTNSFDVKNFGNLSVHNLKTVGLTSGQTSYAPSEMKYLTSGGGYITQSQTDRDPLDSSDFSDSSCESNLANDHPKQSNNDVAYASTSLLFPNQNLLGINSNEHCHSVKTNNAPLAVPEQASIADSKCTDPTIYQTRIVNVYHSQNPIVSAPSTISSNCPLSASSSVASIDQTYGSQNKTIFSRPNIQETKSSIPITSSSNSSTTFMNTYEGQSKSSNEETKPNKPSRTCSKSDLTNQITITDHRLSVKNSVKSGQFTNGHHEVLDETTYVVIGGCTALYSFDAKGFDPCYLPFNAGDQFYILAPLPTENTSEWLRVLRLQSQEPGFVPTAYMEQKHYDKPLMIPHSTQCKEFNSTLIQAQSPTVTRTHPMKDTSVTKGTTSRVITRTYNGNSDGTRIIKANSPYARFQGVTRNTDL